METYNLEHILGGFSSDQLGVIMQNLSAIELTQGCSINCDFCGLEAEKKVRKIMSADDIMHILDLHAQSTKSKKLILYFASEPLDWEYEDMNYFTLAKKIKNEIGFRPFTSTAVPVGKEELMLSMLLEKYIDRVSISHMNYKRLEKLMTTHFPDLQNPLLSRENDFLGSTLRRRISKAIENGHKEYIDAPAWINLISMLQNAEDSRVFTFNGEKNPERLRNLGEKQEDKLSKFGILGEHSVIMTHDGFYNAIDLHPSKQHPYGFYLEKISPEPDKFKVVDYWWMPRESPPLQIFSGKWYYRIFPMEEHFFYGLNEIVQPITTTRAWSKDEMQHIKEPSQTILEMCSVLQRWHSEKKSFDEKTLRNYIQRLRTEVSEYTSWVHRNNYDDKAQNPYYPRLLMAMQQVREMHNNYF